MDDKSMWTSNAMIAVYIAFGVTSAGVAAWLLMRKTLRTRLQTEKALRLDPDMGDWLVIFGWTPKVLYVPTMLAAALASVLMFLHESGWSMFAGIDPKVVGGIWFAIFFVNFLVEEYNVTLKLLIIAFSCTGFLLLWLHLLGWVTGFLGLFGAPGLLHQRDGLPAHRDHRRADDRRLLAPGPLLLCGDHAQ